MYPTISGITKLFIVTTIKVYVYSLMMFLVSASSIVLERSDIKGDSSSFIKLGVIIIKQTTISRKSLYQSRHDSYNHSNVLSHQVRAREKISEGLCKYRTVDAEIYYKHWCDIIDNMISFYRDLNMKRNTGNAFICFKSPKAVDKGFCGLLVIAKYHS